MHVFRDEDNHTTKKTSGKAFQLSDIKFFYLKYGYHVVINVMRGAITQMLAKFYFVYRIYCKKDSSQLYLIQSSRTV